MLLPQELQEKLLPNELTVKDIVLKPDMRTVTSCRIIHLFYIHLARQLTISRSQNNHMRKMAKSTLAHGQPGPLSPA